MDFLRCGVLLASVLVFSACKDSGVPATATDAVHAYCGDDYIEVERRIDRLLRKLTLVQKVRLLRGELGGGLKWRVPGVPDLGIPDLSMIDGPRGVSEIAGHATAFPVEMARGATFDPALEGRIGAVIGHEARAYGRNVLLAPTMNVLAHPRWGRAQETYGEDPFHIGSMALGFIGGAQAEVPVTAKHFAVNSIENTRHEVDVVLAERTLREVYLPHFRRVVQEGRVASIMSAYNSVNGAYCSENQHLLRDILKNEWSFAGFVVSDWTGTEANVNGFDHTIAAANAGLDLEMFVQKIYGEPLHSAVVNGDVPLALVDDMVRRQLRARFCFDLDTNPPVVDPAEIATPAARSLAREAAERSFVLLRNQSNALPIDRTLAMDIVVTGPLANVENIGDTGSSNVESDNIVTVLEGMVAAQGNTSVVHVAAAPTTPSEENVISNADVVVFVVGLTAANEGEAEIGSGDRSGLGLAPADVAWLQTIAGLSNRVVVVLEGGSAITMNDFLSDVEAVLFAWYPGVEGGSAVARTLFGDVNPSGRLPIVFPAAESDLPPFDNTSTSVMYGYFHGYRHLDHESTAPLFPFGFGLSYTTYVYSGLTVSSTTLHEGETLTATLNVQNTGTRAGRETVQLYAGATGSAVSPRFTRELRAFAQVDLAPGETKSVTLSVPVRDLAYWDTDANAFRVEATSYTIEVGHSSRDLPLSTAVSVSP